MTEPKVQPKTVQERDDDPDVRPMLYDPIKNSKTTKINQYLATVIVCLGAVAAGTGLAWTSPTETQLKDPKSSIYVTDDQSSWIGSMLAIGAIIGALPCGTLAQKIGQKKAAIFLCVPYIISYLLIVFAGNVWWLLAARLLVGIAIGGSCVVCPVYISEFAETSIRGILGTCFQLFLTIGILFVFCVGACTSWITLSWWCLIFPIANFIALFFIPESPIWLLKNHQEVEAATAIKWFWGRHCNAKGSIQAIKSELEAAGSGSGSIRDLFFVKANRKGFLICVSLMFFQQFSGVNAVIFYATSIFKTAGSQMDPNVCSIIVGVVQVIMTFVAAALVERAGRKLLLLCSSSVMALCLAVLGFYFFMKERNPENVAAIGIIPLISLVLFIVFFSLGYGPIPWMMTGEMLASDIKSIATSLTVEFNWISVFIVTKTFLPLTQVFGSSTVFWMYGVVMVIGTIYGSIFLFETKGKSNTEIQMKLSGEN